MEVDHGLQVTASSYVRVPSNDAYDFGTGDFTVTVLVQTAQPGSVLSNKSPQTGSSADAGWYLTIEVRAAIRMVTDNGLGYYRVTSIPTAALDNTWHSVAVVRQNGIITVYFDASPVTTAPSTRRHTRLTSPWLRRRTTVTSPRHSR